MKEKIEDRFDKSLERTEHVQQIIERIPTNFGLYVTTVVIFIFTLLLLFGWVIRYPDVISGEIVLNSSISPVKLVAETNGKLKLNLSASNEQVKEGDVIAYIENPTNPSNVELISKLLKTYNPRSADIASLLQKLPKDFSIGELNDQYFNFVISLEQLINYQNGKLLDKRHESLIKTLVEQKHSIEVAEDRVQMASNSLVHARKNYTRDSLLFLKKIISESELDRSKINYNNSQENYQNNLNHLSSSRQQVMSTENGIQEIEVQNPEKKQEIMSYILSTYNKFLDDIKIWEQKYVFRAPFDGKVQFLKFWNNNQFIQAGEQVFTVIPQDNDVVGQVMLPNKGAGKIHRDQEVIVKLDDYPYNEYGSIKGVVSNISLTTNTIKTEMGDVNNYLVIVNFPDQLKTNYGSMLNFKSETRGIADIITNDRRLIERLFDNLKYRTR